MSGSTWVTLCHRDIKSEPHNTHCHTTSGPHNTYNTSVPHNTTPLCDPDLMSR
jgi:hypothetical protein